jgi:hypothetical protein
VKADITGGWDFASHAYKVYDGYFTDGYFGNNPGLGSLPALLTGATTPTMEAWGAKGWADLKPGKPVASMGQFLAELRQLPTLPLKSFRRIIHDYKDIHGWFRALGKEYLNTEFGWKLFLKDLRDIYRLQQSIDRRLAQLARDNGRSIRRRGTLSSNKSTVISVNQTTCLYPVLTTDFYSSLQGTQTITDESFERYWFSARFRYWIPDVGTALWRTRAKRALFGLNPSPSLLWEVMPWSWLADWFGNVGDVLSNMSENAAENLTAEYAFVMHEQVERKKVVEVANLWAKPKPPFVPTTRTVTSTLERSVKQRLAANPYGFGLTFDGLSGRQMAILGALGFSRS